MSRNLRLCAAAVPHAPPPCGYNKVHMARLRHPGKPRPVEFSGLSVFRLNRLFPEAQSLVVHRLKRAIDRSRRFPPLRPGRILEVGSDVAATATTLERV